MKPLHFPKIAAAAAALLMLCSCAGQNDIVIDHSLYAASAYPAVTATDPLIAGIPEDSLPYLYNEPEKESIPDAPVPAAETTSVTAAAVTIPETVTARRAAALPESSGTSAETSVPEEAPKSVSLSGYQGSHKYSYEYQEKNGSLSILGPNLVYTGESFDFNYYYPSSDDSTKVVWSIDGSAGRIDRYGYFTALRKGVCTITAEDKTTGTYASLKVHCISDEDDVDFLPLVNNIPIANKTYPLPKDYDPGLDPKARSAFLELQSDAAALGLNIYPISAYRSYEYQQEVYAGWKAMYGEDADLISARPGHSEHQLGLAIDVNSAEFSFADTPEGKWLRAHCADYGFILRYPSYDSQTYTGYSYEPWHIRYIGKSLAQTVTSTGMTLEECLGIDSYYR